MSTIERPALHAVHSPGDIPRVSDPFKTCSLEPSRSVVSGVIAGAALAPLSALDIPPEHPDFQEKNSFFGEPTFDRENYVGRFSNRLERARTRFTTEIVMPEINIRFERVVISVSRPNDPICDDLVCILVLTNC